MIRVAFLTPDPKNSGGIAAAVDGLRKPLSREGSVETAVFHVARRSRALDLLGGESRRLAREATEFYPDAIHCHGLWVAHSVAARRAARQRGVPEVISPHGMLDAWAFRHRAWKKRLAWQLMERTHLNRAAVVHALCESELASVRALGVRTPIAVIPNGVEPRNPTTSEQPPWHERFDASAKVLLFLGRIHPKKGLDSLIRAWSQAAHHLPDWRLAIVGWDDGQHVAGYQTLIDELKCGSTCAIFGGVTGTAKDATLQYAAAFVLPSHSEGLPVAVLEAWAHELPVLMTAECNLPAGFAAGAAFKISTDVAELSLRLTEVLRQPVSTLHAAGAAGLRLTQGVFSWAEVSRQFMELYTWMIARGPQPPFVSRA